MSPRSLLLAFAPILLVLAACQTTPEQRSIIRLPHFIPERTPAEPEPEPDPNRHLLHGKWELRFDPDDVGLAAGWRSDADGGLWLEHTVPGCYLTAFPDRLWYRGAAWNRREFEVPAEWADDDRLFLAFDGVGLRARIWINGDFAGEFDRPYLPVRIEATDFLRRGEPNLLVVETDNRCPMDASHNPVDARAWPYAGLLRSVALERRPRAFVDGLRVETRMAGDGWLLRVAGSVDQRGGRTPRSVHFRLLDAEGNPIWIDSRPLEGHPDSGTLAFSLDAALNGVQPWTLDAPRLYDLSVALSNDFAEPAQARIGFREVAVQGSGLLLNGEPIQVRGVVWLDESKSSGGSPTRREIHRDLEDIKALGFNLVRCAYRPPSPEVVDWADRNGLLLWVEPPPAPSTAVLGDPTLFEAYTGPYLEAMARAYRTRPSVVLWSLGEGIDVRREEAAWFVENAMAVLRERDGTRPTTIAGPLRDRRPAADALDVFAFNSFAGWGDEPVYALADHLRRARNAAGPDQPVLVSGFGAESIPGNHAEARFETQGRHFSEPYQARVVQAQLEQVFGPASAAAAPIGGILWSYNDHRSPRAVSPDHPAEARGWRLTGLVGADRRPKAARMLVRDFFEFLDRDDPAVASGIPAP